MAAAYVRDHGDRPMTQHLLLITLGPVQEFIAQARRTRDLWFGSHLLSELARAAARALIDGGADLAFPPLARGDAELEPCLAPLRPTGEPPRNFANRLLAEVPAGVDPKELARRTREAVMAFWRDQVAAPVKRCCADLLAPGIDAVWEEQIGDFVEFTAAWAPLRDYQVARHQVENAVAARKNLRDFSPWQQQRGSVPKSSLDGARETVLAEPKKRDPKLARKYRIADGEELDAVGLVKRAGGQPDQFVPVVNVALASWIEAAAERAGTALEKLKEACKATGLAPVQRPNLPCARKFPFDASVLLRGRWRPMFQEQGLPGDSEAWGRQYVAPLLNALEDPYPYVACLVADGDRVGRTISRLQSVDRHRAFSRAVAEFATGAREIIEQKHRGILIYSGGDDALGFLPLPEALACADELRRRFSAIAADACGSLPKEDRPTLSVGLGVGHVMESMGDLLALGREAEGLAKRNRDSLAIIVDKRSGGKRAWSELWEADPVRRLLQDTAVLEMRLSLRKVYEIATTLRRLPRPGTVGQDSAWAQLLAREVWRSLSRAGEGGVEPYEVGLTLDTDVPYSDLHGRVSAWVDRMLIASTFARAVPKQGSRFGEMES